MRNTKIQKINKEERFLPFTRPLLSQRLVEPSGWSGNTRRGKGEMYGCTQRFLDAHWMQNFQDPHQNFFTSITTSFLVHIIKNG